MYPYLGDFPTGQTIFFPFHTFKADGSSITLTGLAVTDIEVYKGASMTQRSSDAGYALVDTDGIDLDGVTGIHGFTIDTSDNTDAGFFAAGNDYTVVVASVTVDAVTVSFIAGRFSIDNRGLLRPTVASRTLDVSSTGEAGVDWANVGSPTTSVALTGTSVLLTSGTSTGQVSLSSGKVSITDGAIAAATFAADAITAAKIASDVGTEIAAAVLAATVESEGTVTVGGALRLMLAVLAGVTTVSGATYTVKTSNGVATRVTFTLNASKERTAVTLAP